MSKAIYLNIKNDREFKKFVAAKEGSTLKKAYCRLESEKFIFENLTPAELRLILNNYRKFLFSTKPGLLAKLKKTTQRTSLLDRVKQKLSAFGEKVSSKIKPFLARLEEQTNPKIDPEAPLKNKLLKKIRQQISSNLLPIYAARKSLDTLNKMNLVYQEMPSNIHAIYSRQTLKDVPSDYAISKVVPWKDHGLVYVLENEEGEILLIQGKDTEDAVSLPEWKNLRDGGLAVLGKLGQMMDVAVDEVINESGGKIALKHIEDKYGINLRKALCLGVAATAKLEDGFNGSLYDNIRDINLTAGRIDGLIIGTPEMIARCTVNPFLVGEFLATPIKSAKDIWRVRQTAKQTGDYYTQGLIEGNTAGMVGLIAAGLAPKAVRGLKALKAEKKSLEAVPKTAKPIEETKTLSPDEKPIEIPSDSEAVLGKSPLIVGEAVQLEFESLQGRPIEEVLSSEPNSLVRRYAGTVESLKTFPPAFRWIEQLTSEQKNIVYRIISGSRYFQRKSFSNGSTTFLKNQIAEELNGVILGSALQLKLNLFKLLSKFSVQGHMDFSKLNDVFYVVEQMDISSLEKLQTRLYNLIDYGNYQQARTALDSLVCDNPHIVLKGKMQEVLTSGNPEQLSTTLAGTNFTLSDALMFVERFPERLAEIPFSENPVELLENIKKYLMRQQVRLIGDDQITDFINQFGPDQTKICKVDFITRSLLKSGNLQISEVLMELPDNVINDIISKIYSESSGGLPFYLTNLRYLLWELSDVKKCYETQIIPKLESTIGKVKYFNLLREICRVYKPEKIGSVRIICSNLQELFSKILKSRDPVEILEIYDIFLLRLEGINIGQSAIPTELFYALTEDNILAGRILKGIDEVNFDNLVRAFLKKWGDEPIILYQIFREFLEAKSSEERMQIYEKYSKIVRKELLARKIISETAANFKTIGESSFNRGLIVKFLEEMPLQTLEENFYYLLALTKIDSITLIKELAQLVGKKELAEVFIKINELEGKLLLSPLDAKKLIKKVEADPELIPRIKGYLEKLEKGRTLKEVLGLIKMSEDILGDKEK